MKEKMIFGLAVLFLVALTGMPAVYAEEDDTGASDQAQKVAPVPSTFDGGEGATLNEDSGKNSGPDVSDVKEVMSQDDNGGSAPSTLNEDSGKNSGSDVPDVKEVMSQDDNGGSAPSTLDGGEGAALNEDSGQNSGFRMPHVKKVMSQDDTGGSDPSAFEGDSDSRPGERAPEDLPMDDAPVDAGIGVR